jgi:hypothetical protein
MALFKRSYRDTLRQLKKETAATPQQSNNVRQSDPFVDVIVDISHDHDEITNAELYKQYHKKYIIPYEIEHDKNNGNNGKGTANPFDEAMELLPTFIQNENISDDFLTGFYLARFHIDHTDVVSFHAGLSSDGIIRGMYYGGLKKCDWSLHGCDRVISDKYSKLYINGITKCDIYNKNSASSIKIHLSEKFRPRSINLYTVDICPSTAMDILRAYLLLVDCVSTKGTIIMRLPTKWKSFYTPMLNILLFMTHFYKTVKLFSAPWSDKSKFYLILSGAKDVIPAKIITNLQSYVECGDDTQPLIIETFMREYEEVVSNIKSIYEKFHTDVYTDSDYNTARWVDLVSENSS